MQQLSLDLGILPENSQTSTYDPYWDEITSEGEGVGGQPLNSKSQIEAKFQVGDKVFAHSLTVGGVIYEIKSWGDILVLTDEGSFWSYAEALTLVEKVSGLSVAPGDDCPPTIQIGDRIRDTSPIRPQDKEGVVLEVHSTWCEVLWDGWGHPSNHCLDDLELAHQQLSPCKSVGGQVNNITNNFAHQHIFTGKSVGGQVENDTKNLAHQHNGWVEKYSVSRNCHKYYYWRFTWREGRKKCRRYIGSCTNPKAGERMEMVKSAIALGKLPHEIVELI